MAKRSSKLKAKYTVIAWTPDTPEMRDIYPHTAGKVAVGGFADDRLNDYAYVGGAAYKRIQQAKGLETIFHLLFSFHHLVVNYGIDPQVIHKAFLNIEEYAAWKPSRPASKHAFDSRFQNPW